MGKPKIIAVVGPNAAGKSALAVRLAKKFNGEIISADSRQVYQGLNIGTGKISKKEMGGVRHHLLNVASPRQQFTVARYQKLAGLALKNILVRRKLPIICGGTGFYIQVITDNLKLPPVKPVLELREKLERKTTKELAEILEKLDSRRAKTIDRKNRRRLIRAIEIAKQLGTIPSLKKTETRFNVLKLGVKIAPVELRQKIKRRLRQRLDAGLINEVRKLHQKGISWKRFDELGLEYRYVSYYLRGELTREEMIKKLETAIWHYAKRQMTWFKKDKEIRWIKNYRQAERLVSDFL